MPSSRSGSPSTSGEHGAVREHAKQLKEKRWERQRDPKHRQQQLERRAQRNVVETKHGQWKAASARYYENHPEVRERKRLKMAEQRAAKKLARRRWDPPKKSKPNPLQSDPLQSDAPESDNEAREAAAAAQSLLFLQQYGKRNAVAANPSPSDARNPFPDDLPPSDELPTSEEEDEPSAKSGHGTSGRWAVLTPSDVEHVQRR
ncbi:hypothetical protein B0H10DRAFT_1950859 [Mycena sp. CBHHK59/15]|nr:hypothetical protein B0H10DRAFT_1950859 [Mycena sp. CBHHK59/15]